jgi:hypothetical protein
MYRPIHEIAREISADHRLQGRQVYFGAVPYLHAASALNSLTDSYGLDSADSILIYLVSNLGTWRGETARRVKAEIKAMLARKPVGGKK